MSVPTRSPAPLLRDLIDIPQQVSAGDFVLRLLEGIDRRAQTVADYVVTDQLVTAFDSALGLIGSALAANNLQGQLPARVVRVPARATSWRCWTRCSTATRMRWRSPSWPPVIARHRWLGTRQLMLVPTNLIGAESLEAGILGGYAQHAATHHPDQPVPALLRAGGMLADLARIRDAMGPEAFR